MLDKWDDRSWLARLGDATSQFFNVLLFNGMPDESISGRSWRNTELKNPPLKRWYITRYAAEVLFWFRDRGNHCEAAFYEDIERSRKRAKFTK